MVYNRLGGKATGIVRQVVGGGIAVLYAKEGFGLGWLLRIAGCPFVNCFEVLAAA
jgi:hypothetical protein